MPSSKPLDLFAIGTPLIDRFAQADDSFLLAHHLARGSSNYLDDAGLIEVERALRGRIRAEYPGDNARNVCEGFLTLAKENATAVLGKGKRTDAAAPKIFAASFRVGYCGKIARDAPGRLFERNLEKIGARSFLQYGQTGQTGRITCLISPDKERTFAVYLGASSDAADISGLPSARFVFCTSITLMTSGAIRQSALDYVRRAKKEGSKIALSLESPAMLGADRQKALGICRLADILFLNEDEAGAIGFSQDDVASLAPLVFLKKGKNGSLVFKGSRMLLSMPAQQVKKVADTTGAGDAYAAGALWALSNGRDEKEAALAGSRLAARIIQRVGNEL